MAARMGEGVEGPRARGNRAKRWRKVVISPDFRNHHKLRYTSFEMAGNLAGKVALGIVCCCGFLLAALLFLYFPGGLFVPESRSD
jgi:hypothetical protein